MNDDLSQPNVHPYVESTTTSTSGGLLRDELLGKFEPDLRQIALHDRLSQYYKDTPDSVSNQQAMTLWADFKQWCQVRGYTQEEINHAKKQGLAT